MKILKYLLMIYKYIAITALTFLMFFITIGVFSRFFFRPILGDVELVQLGMVVVIIFGVMYSESIDGHISIGLVVDKLPNKPQKYLSVLAYFLTFSVSTVVAIVFFNLSIDHYTNAKITTNLLKIPFYPFDFLIFLGFLGWGGISFIKMIFQIMDKEYDFK